MYREIGSSNHEWGGKTYTEINDIAGSEGSILVVPIGSLEQHGYHLPVATDTILSEAVVDGGANRVVEELPVLSTPPIWIGNSPHHMEFGGTITADYVRIINHLESVIGSALTLGFDGVLVVNGHGGNIPLVGTAISAIGHHHSEALITGITYYHLASSFIDDLRDSERGGMAHGGEFETSLMIHVRPDLVDEERMEATNFDDPFDHRGQDLFDRGPLSVYRPFGFYTDSGAIGDPARASAEKGSELYELLTGELAALLRELHGQLED